MSDKNSHNCNEDITIRRLSEEDLYDGIIVQSTGNIHCLYELKQCKPKGTGWVSQVSHYVELRQNHYRDNSLIDDGSYDVSENTSKDSFESCMVTHWCETIYSIRFNKKDLREHKIKNLLENKKEEN